MSLLIYYALSGLATRTRRERAPYTLMVALTGQSFIAYTIARWQIGWTAPDRRYCRSSVSLVPKLEYMPRPFRGTVNRVGSADSNITCNDNADCHPIIENYVLVRHAPRHLRKRMSRRLHRKHNYD